MKNVSAKLLKVIGNVSGKVKKSGYNSHQKYHYVLEGDVLDVVRDELVKQGLLVLMSVDSSHRVGELTTVHTLHTIIDIDTGEKLEIRAVGEGYDKTDKSSAKACTMASKYFWLKTMMLSGGDDPENDSPVVNTTHQKSVDKPTTSFGLKKPESEQTEPVKKPTFGLKKPTTEKVEY